MALGSRTGWFLSMEKTLPPGTASSWLSCNRRATPYSPSSVLLLPHREYSSLVRVSRAARSTQTCATAGCKLLGVGSSVPENVLTNVDLEGIVETSDEWITRRTGIRERRVLGTDELLADHAVHASTRALEMAGVEAEELELVIMATSSPDDIFGSACQVQNKIGAKNAVAFDITAACSGFVVSLNTAAQFIRSGVYKKVLVIGADALSRVVDWRDRTTCILFGDGCGAVVMSANDNGDSLLGMAMHSDGEGQKNLHALFDASHFKARAEGDGASRKASFCNLQMNGQEVFKWAVRGVPMVIEEALASGNLESSQVDWLVMHQANQRILESAANRLGLPKDRVISNLGNYGNTSAGSIPLALDESVRSGLIKPGDMVAMAGFGAGLTIAASIVRWG